MKAKLSARTKRWLFVLAIVTVILSACIIQIRSIHPFGPN
jgi:hypothetical protein